ncbi:hypothetical protein KR032_008936 [Drosophila birchii]|nr:hypothetical protein KR032_008936 [Drosophila birchii]
MKLFVFAVLLSCCLAVHAAPEKKLLARSRNVEVEQEQDAKLGMASASGAAGAAGAGAGASGAQVAKDPSSGRLFLKKFLTFKNLFSSSNQPVIPIIITGAGTSTGTATAPTSPTVTVTSTGTIPSASGTITTSPTTPTTPTTTARFTVRKSYGDEEPDQDQDQDQDQEQDQEQDQDQELQQPAQAYPADLMDEQALQAALAAGAQEYEVVTQPEIQGSGQSKATQSSHISLRRKGARRGQVISVRIPPRYRRYFKNGQKVMLNTGSRPVTKRRVVRKRVPSKRINNNNKGNKNMNRRRVGGKKNRKNRNKNRRRITAV